MMSYSKQILVILTKAYELILKEFKSKNIRENKYE
jgi:hypothetical protein